jgi:hypothetical protein
MKILRNCVACIGESSTNRVKFIVFSRFGEFFFWPHISPFIMSVINNRFQLLLCASSQKGRAIGALMTQEVLILIPIYLSLLSELCGLCGIIGGRMSCIRNV